MRETPDSGRQQWVAAGIAAAAALLMALVVALTPHSASTYTDPNNIGPFVIDSFQDVLDAAIVKCALGRPDCVGQTAGTAGVVNIGFDGVNYQMQIQTPGAPPIVADKIKGKAMKLFQDQMALANSLAPGTDDDPNQPVQLSDHTDPNSADVTITSTLSFKVRTGDDRKGVITVSVSPSFAVRWDLKLKK